MDTALIILLPSWGNVLVFVSWLLSEAASCLVILSFNERYALAILAFLFLILVVALLQPKLKHAMKRYDLPSFTNGDTQDDIDDEENKYLGYLFELAQGIVNCGGMVTAIFGHYMVGPVTAVGFFFFCSIALGLYLMMVITVRAVARPHVTCLAIVLMVLLVITLITVSIPFARHSG
jgi:ubiquitin C